MSAADAPRGCDITVAADAAAANLRAVEDDGEFRPTSRASTAPVSLPELSPAESESAAAEAESESLAALEWPRLSRQVGAYAQTAAVRARLLRGPGLPLPRTRETSEELHALTEAAIAFERRKGSWPSLSGVADVCPAAIAASKGAGLDEVQLAEVASTLAAAKDLVQAVRALDSELAEEAELVREDPAKAAPSLEGEGGDAVAALREVVDAAPLSGGLLRTLRLALDESGRVRDSASAELSSARTRASTLLASIRKELAAIAQGPKGDALAERTPVVRGNRLCLAVKAGQRSRIKGAQLDESASGQTVFVEPREVQDLGAKLAQAERDEKRALAAVLKKLSAAVGAAAGDLQALAAALEVVDLSVARARWSLAVGGLRVRLRSAGGGASLRAFRHPLLEFPLDGGPHAAAQAPAAAPGASTAQSNPARASIVAVDYDVAPGVKCVVITGPNTGGKTASLKGFGIAALLARAGLRLPCQPSPGLEGAQAVAAVWHDRVMADVGDGQSLAQSLSTFSAHVRRVRLMAAGATPASLCLLDEVGMGTDPDEGSAIAAATLLALSERAALTLATTHHSSLKALKYESPAFENAAVEFDEATLAPTYKVLWGVPGRSHALSIAQRLGLDPAVLERARARLGGEALSVDELVTQLQHERRRHQRAAAAAEEAAGEAERARRSAEADAARFRREAADAEAKLRASFEAELADARKEVAAAVARLQAAGAGATGVREGSADATRASARLAELQDNLGTGSRGEASMGARAAAAASRRGVGAIKAPADAAPGDLVVHKTLGEVRVSQTRKGGLTVINGNMQIKVKTRDIVEVLGDTAGVSSGQGGGGAKSGSQAWAPTPGSQPAQIAARLAANQGKKGPAKGRSAAVSKRPTAQVPANTVDVRGEFVDDAVQLVDRAIARANQYGAVYVIHGHGTGRLRDGVRAALKQHPFVVRQEDASQGGVTVAYLRD